MPTWIAYWNGRFVKDDEISISPSDRGFVLGDAVYEATRTYRHVPFHLDRHLDRLVMSLHYLALDAGLTRADLERLTFEVLDANRAHLQPHQDVSLIHRITRGPNVPPFGGPPPGPPTVLITCRPVAFARFAPYYREGVELMVPEIRVPAVGGVDPRVKTQSRLLLSLGAIEASRQGPGVLALFEDAEGRVTESSASSVFFVIGERLVTAPDEAVLGGITRSVIFDLAARLGLEAERRPVPRAELGRASEALVTATSYAILPVHRLDGRALGPVPGPVTARLTAAFSEYVGLDIIEQSRLNLDASPAHGRVPR